MKIFIVILSATIVFILSMGWLATNDPDMANQITTSVKAAADNKEPTPDTASASPITTVGFLVAALVLMGVFKVIASTLFKQLNFDLEKKQ